MWVCVIEITMNLQHDQALNVLTTRTTYCLQMGHSAICLPQLTHVHMWPHSSITQSTGLSMQILHSSSSSRVSLAAKGASYIAYGLIHRKKGFIFTWLHFLFLKPESFNKFEQFVLFHHAFEVDPIHGQDVFGLLGRKILNILDRLDVRQIDQTLVGKSFGTRWRWGRFLK